MDGEEKDTLIHPIHQHKSTRVKVQTVQSYRCSRLGDRQAKPKLAHGNLTSEAMEGCLELQELPDEPEPKWQ